MDNNSLGERAISDGLRQLLISTAIAPTYSFYLPEPEFQEYLTAHPELHNAEQLGLIEFDLSGGGWGYMEGFKLTDKGRRLVGAPAHVSRWTRALRFLSYGKWATRAARLVLLK